MLRAQCGDRSAHESLRSDSSPSERQRQSVCAARDIIAAMRRMLALAGGMALLLGLAGIYGVMSYSVSQKTREIGIRVALGARNEEVIRMFVAHGARLATVGIVCGLIAAAALTRFMSSMLFNVSAGDPATYLVVCAALVTAAVVASYLPALRATSIDPVEALRAE